MMISKKKRNLLYEKATIFSFQALQGYDNLTPIPKTQQLFLPKMLPNRRWAPRNNKNQLPGMAGVHFIHQKLNGTFPTDP